MLLLVTLVVGVSAAVCQIWTRLQVIDYGYKLSKANREHRRLRELNRKLRIEYALLKNPAQISHTARTKLGMHPPRPEQIRRIRGARRAAKQPKLARRQRGRHRRPR